MRYLLLASLFALMASCPSIPVPPGPICQSPQTCGCYKWDLVEGRWVEIVCPSPEPEPTPEPTPTPDPSPEPTPEPTPDPTPTPTPDPGTGACRPSVCPSLRLVGAYFYSPWAPSSDTITVVRGSTVVLDMTPRFNAPGNSPRGVPCNAEKYCCITQECYDARPDQSQSCMNSSAPPFTDANSRRCEDPRGGVWRTNHPTSSGGGDFEFFKLTNVQKGTWWVEVCPVPNYRDAEGVPVPVGPNPCTRKTVKVN